MRRSHPALRRARSLLVAGLVVVGPSLPPQPAPTISTHDTRRPVLTQKCIATLAVEVAAITHPGALEPTAACCEPTHRCSESTSFRASSYLGGG